MRVGLAQTSPISAPPGPPTLDAPHTSSPFPSLDSNLIDVVSHVERAIKDGAEVVVFPEYFLQGIVNESRQYLTFPADHLLSFIQSLAKQHRISIVGTIVHGSLPSSAQGQAFPRSSPFSHIPTASSTSAHSLHHPLTTSTKITDGQLEWAKYLEAYPESPGEEYEPILKNTAFFIDENGDLVGNFEKKNLWHPEREYLTAGDQKHEVFDTKWGKAGLLICWDVSHPASAQELANMGADIIFAPTYWLANDSEPLISNHPHEKTYETTVLSSLSFARCFETETVWIMVNAGGDTEEGFIGGSAIWSPLSGKVGGWDWNVEGVEKASAAGLRVVDVDLGILKDARKTYKIREDWSARNGS